MLCKSVGNTKVGYTGDTLAVLDLSFMVLIPMRALIIHDMWEGAISLLCNTADHKGTLEVTWRGNI